MQVCVSVYAGVCISVCRRVSVNGVLCVSECVMVGVRCVSIRTDLYVYAGVCISVCKYVCQCMQACVSVYAGMCVSECVIVAARCVSIRTDLYMYGLWARGDSQREQRQCIQQPWRQQKVVKAPRLRVGEGKGQIGSK